MIRRFNSLDVFDDFIKCQGFELSGFAGIKVMKPIIRMTWNRLNNERRVRCKKELDTRKSIKEGWDDDSLPRGMKMSVDFVNADDSRSQADAVPLKLGVKDCTTICKVTNKLDHPAKAVTQI